MEYLGVENMSENAGTETPTDRKDFRLREDTLFGVLSQTFW
jgi:hypothetical protein